MNEYDSGRISDFTKAINYRKTENFKEADCFVLNTCHIREKATEKMFHEIGRIKKEYKDKKKPIVLITGCVAQAEGEIILKKSKYVDAVIGPQSYQKINEIIKKIENNNKEKIDETNFDTIKKFDTLSELENKASKVFNYITVQEGCDKFCKFCVVPYTRGVETSRPFEQIICEVKSLIKNGCKDITLLGQNVNAYNYKGKKLSDIIFELEKLDNLQRVRYTTSHPKDMTEDLILAHGRFKKLMPLIHLPVQSGSNKILDSMNRRHSVEYYLDKIKKLKKINANLEFTGDFIIGYPGETEEDFHQSINLLKKVKYIQVFSFVYSPRPGTPSSDLSLINSSIAKERLIKFQSLADKYQLDFKRKLIGKTVKVLIEKKINNQNSYFGRDEYMNSVITNKLKNENLIGKVVEVEIQKTNKQTMLGTIINNFKTEKEFAA